MPSLGIHLLVADEAFSRLSKSQVPRVRDLSPLTHHFPEMASLGAIGPDLLYYLGEGPKISAAVADVFHFLNQISNVLNEVGNLAQQGGFPNVADRIKQLGNLVQLAVGTGQVGLLASVVQLNEIITGSHLFNPSAAQKEEKEDQWNWGDLLHDRISGTFATMIMEKALTAKNYAAMSYATGYMTHLATDFVGHAYVNTVVGGPARGWNMRHTVAEKFMDATVFSAARRDINTSGLHRKFSSLADTPELFSLTSLLAGLIADLTNTPNLGFPLPGPCTPNEIKVAFDSMCSLFRLVTEDAYVPAPKPPGISIPPLPGQYGSITNAVNHIPPPGRPHSLSDWLRWLLAFLLKFPAILADLVRFVADAALGVITYPLAAAVYVFQANLYSLYRSVRWFLVLSGVLFPCLDELGTPLGLQFTTSRGYSDDGYPHIPPDVSKWRDRVGAITFTANNFDYLNYPATKSERPLTMPSPYPKGSRPELFMFELAPDEQYIQAWANTAAPSDLVHMAHLISINQSSPKGGFGNAADLSVRLLEDRGLARLINLDSDRGYSYRQWTCDGGIKAGLIINERFL